MWYTVYDENVKARWKAVSEKTYIAIDLKSFYASVECVERGLNPLTTHLVVADPTRTEKTICLAVSPALKAYGVPGRARLFEAIQRVNEVNAARKKAAGGRLSGKSFDAPTLENHPEMALDFIVAPPQMAKYMEKSSQIYSIYLKYVAPEDIHVYSVDEVFIDATPYLKARKMTARQFTSLLISDVLKTTGITATAGIAPNLYLCKIAMDIEAKHIPADRDGVRIAELSEEDYRRKLWEHRPLTDFWRIGPGYAKKLEQNGMFTMGDVARCSLGGPLDRHNEALLYKLFGINAELLIDHAWGVEPCTIADIKSYVPENNSLHSGQVLQNPYSAEKGRLIAREMADLMSLDLVDKGLVTDQMVLTVCYDVENMKKNYQGEVAADRYGRKAPKPVHGSRNLSGHTASTKEIVAAVTEIYDRIVDKTLTVRRLYIEANHVIREQDIPPKTAPEQLDLFTDYAQKEAEEKADAVAKKRERSMQKALLSIKKKYGKNAVLKGRDFEEGATTRERNGQVGGHKA